MTGKSVVLRNVRDAQGTRHLQATLTGEGDLVIEGQDLGDGVEQIFGVREYEWIWTIRARDLPSLLDAMGGSSNVLATLRERFSGDNAAELKSFLDSHDVPHEVWSRMGD
jgi:hypothetical protein